MAIDRLLTDRARRIDASGIRRVFELGAKLKDPINLSIGQPDFPVPEPIRRAATEAMAQGRNGYTLSQGIPELRERLARTLREDVGWETEGPGAQASLLVTTGTSGALMLAFLSLLGPGDEAIIPDPYFVIYPHLATICDARAVRCDTYPDFQLTAERVEPLITARTKFVLLNSPGNPSGAVASARRCAELLDLCRRKNILLISDEIYDEFTYSESRTEPAGGEGGSGLAGGAPRLRCPSPARLAGAPEGVLLVRGFGKTYGVTGWRLGYAAGPPALIDAMTKLQQYTYVCAPAPLQWGAAAALDVDMSGAVGAYEIRRDRVVDRLRAVTGVAVPGGAFYAFPRIPERLGLTGAQFIERCLAKSLLVIPGNVFSSRDTHFRLSYAADDRTLERGLDVLVEIMGG